MTREFHISLYEQFRPNYRAYKFSGDMLRLNPNVEFEELPPRDKNWYVNLIIVSYKYLNDLNKAIQYLSIPSNNNISTIILFLTGWFCWSPSPVPPWTVSSYPSLHSKYQWASRSPFPKTLPSHSYTSPSNSAISSTPGYACIKISIF